MKKASKVLTIINYSSSGFMWLLGTLFLVFNILGKWAAWHLAGYAFILSIFIPLISSFVASIFTLFTKPINEKDLFNNILLIFMNVNVIIFSLLVSCTWFW